MKKIFLALLLSLSLIAVIVTGITGCSDSQKAEETTTAVSETTTATTAAETTSEPAATASASEEAAIGEGSQQFLLTVTERDGSAVKFRVNTDETIVGKALFALGLVDGTDSEYGFMVDTVNGGKCDFNADGYYWAFYIDGEYAMTGLDMTAIEEGKSYELRAQQ